MDRKKQVKFICKTLKRLFKDNPDVKVTCAINKPLKGLGVVTVIGREIPFEVPMWLPLIAQYATNMEAYPKTDGKVQMNFTFYGLTRPGRQEVWK